MVWAMFVTRHGKAWIENLYHKFLLFEFSIQKTAFINTDISCFLFDFMVPADGRTAQKWDGPPNRGPLGEPGFCIFHSTAVSLTFQHQLAKIESEVWVTRLWNLSHPPVSIKSPASRRKMRVPHQTILTDSDHTLLYHKLVLSNTSSHAKNRNDPCPATWSKAALPEVGFSIVAILEAGDCSHPPPMAHRQMVDATFISAVMAVRHIHLRTLCIWLASRI